MPRKVYLEDIPLDEARRRFDEALSNAGALQPIEAERVPVGRARMRPELVESRAGGSDDRVGVRERVRVERATLPVLLMSGYADAVDATQLPLLRKPFTREQLAAAVLRITTAK